MILKEKLAIKLRAEDPVDILKQLGYKNIRQKSLNRLSQLVNDDDMGLSQSYYDYKYTQLEFIKAICDILSIKFDDHIDEIEVIEQSYC